MRIPQLFKTYFIAGCLSLILNGFTPQLSFAQNTIWVSTSGNDATGNGSQATPYQTINHAISFVNTFISTVSDKNEGTYWFKSSKFKP